MNEKKVCTKIQACRRAKKKQYFPHIFGLVGLQKINKRAKKPFRIRLCYCYCVELGRRVIFVRVAARSFDTT